MEEKWRQTRQPLYQVKKTPARWITEKGTRKQAVIINMLRSNHTRLANAYLIEGIQHRPIYVSDVTMDM